MYSSETLVFLLSTVSRCECVPAWWPGDPVLSRQYRTRRQSECTNDTWVMRVCSKRPRVGRGPRFLPWKSMCLRSPVALVNSGSTAQCQRADPRPGNAADVRQYHMLSSHAACTRVLNTHTLQRNKVCAPGNSSRLGIRCVRRPAK